MDLACAVVVALLVFAIFLVTIVGFIVRSQTKPAGTPDGQVRLGPDGFAYLTDGGAAEVGYQVELVGGERRTGTFTANGAETWVYTGARPLRVTILGSRPLGAPPKQHGSGGFKPGGGGGYKYGGSPPHAHHDPHHQHAGYPHDQHGWQGGYQPPAEWGGSSSGGGPDYPQTYSGDSAGAGYDYTGGGGESGGGGSSVSWDSGSSGGNDSYPSAY